jgi:hypothetical protein
MIEWDYAYIRVRIMFNLATGMRLFEGNPEQCWDYARRNGWELVSVDNGIAYFKKQVTGAE